MLAFQFRDVKLALNAHISINRPFSFFLPLPYKMVLHTYSSDVLQIQLLPVNSYFKVAQPCTWSFTDFRHFGENDLVERSQAATTYNNSLRAIEARKNISNRMKRLIGCLLYKVNKENIKDKEWKSDFFFC